MFDEDQSGVGFSVASRNGTVSFVRLRTDHFFGSPRDLRPPDDVTASQTYRNNHPPGPAGWCSHSFPT